jgi:succinylarginine dihydrolase
MSAAIEANFDGLVGPTHNYAGLSDGNLASQRHAASVSRPRKAALQGLAKARLLADLGLVQHVLPPHERPFLPGLRALGFTGSDARVLADAWATDPRLVATMSSSAQMWAANAATVSPSADTEDGRLHLTPANLSTMAHRAIEAEQTTRTLRAIFADADHFAVHDPLPGHRLWADEGAANHMRLCADFGAPGVEIMVDGRDGFAPLEPGFPARQTRQAGEAIFRRHGLSPARAIHLRQSRAAIAAGAFHNDVVAVASREVLLTHEQAFEDREAAHAAIARACEGLVAPVIVEAAAREVSLQDAIAAYLFNTQLVAIPGESGLTLIAPEECREVRSVADWIAREVGPGRPIGRVVHVDVRQSMRNGGGPACLRLRVVMTGAQQSALSARTRLDAALHAELIAWVEAHFRETLSPADLADPKLLEESRAALDALTGILRLPRDHYPFQRG